MTSLARQLARLKDAPAVAQGVERDYSSLIFDKKEAASIDREQAFKIGLNGLAQLMKLDPEIDTWEPQLFEESCLNFNRTMINAEQNDGITASLERMIAVLAPYFHHQACKQVLEWLIYRFQIHNFDGEFLATAFLPFHDMNSFGRLGHILLLKKREWAWLKEQTKDASPVPFSVLTRQCLIAGGSMHLIGAVTNFVTYLTKTFDEDYISKHYQYYFIFYTKLIASLLQDSAQATDSLVSRIIPQIGLALKSKIVPFKISGMVLISQLVITVSVSAEVLSHILKLLMHNVRPKLFATAMNTVLVICQRQTVQFLPEKSVRKLIVRQEENNFLEFLTNAQKESDLSGFLRPFWRTLLYIYKRGIEDEERADFDAILNVTTDSNVLSRQQAIDLMDIVLESLITQDLVKLPNILTKNMKFVILAFSDEFDVLRAKHLKEHEEPLESLLEQCRIQPHEIGEITQSRKRRRRRRSSARSVTDHSDADDDMQYISKEKKFANSKEEPKRSPFKKSPLEIVAMLEDEDWEQASWALGSIKNPKYRDAYPSGDFEKFIVKAVKLVSTSKVLVAAEITSALAYLPLRAQLALSLIRRADSQPAAKKAKSNDVNHTTFLDETDEQYQKRLGYALEILNVNAKCDSDAQLFVALFDVIDDILAKTEHNDMDNYIIKLIVCLFLKYVKNPNSISAISKSLRLDSIVKVIRFTYDHSVLRSALQLLALLSPIMPGAVVNQIMSVFTFMGDGGLLKKDNELTLSIVEEALHALFTAIVQSEKSSSRAAKVKIRQRLLEVCRIFAISLLDVPAHRRMRVLRAVANTVSSSDIWILLATIYEDFCAKWHKSATKKDEGDMLHDVALEFMIDFEPEQQLESMINLIDYVIYLGGDYQTAADRLEQSSMVSKFESLVIFDRNARSLQKLRHYRFLVFGFVLRFLNYKPFYEQLGTLNDDELYQRMISVGKDLLITVTNMTDFIDRELKSAEKSQQELAANKKTTESDLNAANHTVRYWIALAAKSDIVGDRMRCLLPANVSGHIICDLLADADNNQNNVDARIRDRALQLLNIKLMTQSSAAFDGTMESGEIQAEYLMKFAKKLNEWIIPAESRDEITRCQNAAFSLKLVAKRIPAHEGQKVFTETMERCSAVLKIWSSLDEAMVGNVLLLVGELARSQNLKAIMLHSDVVCSCLVDVLKVCEKQAHDILEQIEVEQAEKLEQQQNEQNGPVSETIEPVNNRRQRVSQLSLCGKQYGDDILLLCSLTCAQRLFDHSASYISEFYEQFIHVICQLSSKYLRDSTTSPDTPTLTSPRMDNIQLRLNFIRSAMSRQELHLLVEPFKNVVAKFAKRPLGMASVALIITDTLKASKSDFVVNATAELVELFMLLFKFRRTESKLEKFAMYNQCEDAIVGAFLAMIDHMKADGLKPIMNCLIDHLQNAESDGSSSRLMALTVFNFANQFYESYHSLAVPYFAQLFEYAVPLLHNLNAAKVDASELFIDGSESDSLGAAQVDRLIRLVVDFITNCAKNASFFNEDMAKMCYETVLDEIENTAVDGHEERCVRHLSNCIYSLAESSVDLFNREICNMLLMKTRHSSSKVRLRTVLIFERLVDRMGDALAPLLPAIVQYLSELLEDTSKRVVTQCEKTIRLLREKFGNDLLGNSNE